MPNCIIVDDEFHAISSLKGYIKMTPGFNLIASYVDPLVAQREICDLDENVDLLLLDINMPQINGLDLSKSIRGKIDKLVFTTAHTKYAFEAFNVYADGYLLKPYSINDFLSLMIKLFPDKTKSATANFFLIKSKEDKNAIVKIEYDKIIAIESNLNYCIIHQVSGKVIAYTPLHEISRMLKSGTSFIQLQRSFIINIAYIKSIVGTTIIMVNDLSVSVGKYYLPQFNQFLAQYLINGGKKSG